MFLRFREVVRHQAIKPVITGRSLRPQLATNSTTRLSFKADGDKEENRSTALGSQRDQQCT